MTAEEAAKIIALMGFADGGCAYCHYDLVERFAIEFPEITILNIDGEKITGEGKSNISDGYHHSGCCFTVEKIFT